MKINIFSGARRLALIIGVLGAAIGVATVFNQAPYIHYNYRIPNFGTEYIKSDECNDSTDATKILDYKNDDGSSFYVNLCFAAIRADNGEMLVPFEKKDGQLQLNGKYSDDVNQYANLFAKYFFTLKPADFEKAKTDYSREKIWIKLRGLGYILLGLIAYVFTIGIIGWVARGFLGIPSGHDFRTEVSSSKHS